jgi:hypothetical protein
MRNDNLLAACRQGLNDPNRETLLDPVCHHESGFARTGRCAIRIGKLLREVIDVYAFHSGLDFQVSGETHSVRMGATECVVGKNSLALDHENVRRNLTHVC